MCYKTTKPPQDEKGSLPIVMGVLSAPALATGIGLISVHQIAALNHGRTPLLAAFLVAAAYALILNALGILAVVATRRWARSGYVIDAKHRDKRDAGTKRILVTTMIGSLIPFLTLLLRIPTVDLSIGNLTSGVLFLDMGIGSEALLALGYLIHAPGPIGPLQPLDRVGT